MDLKSFHKIHFIGIGGIGMSAIARFLHSQGKVVSGYDKTSTTLTKKLESEGMDIHYEEDIKLAPKDADLVVFTPAVPDEHIELTWFRENGYPVIKRAEVLGLISRESKAIAVAGTHGKTTTSSLVTQLLTYGGIDFSAFLGGIVLEQQSNYINCGNEWVVLEADEYDRSFLHLSPQIAVLLSMDADHLDIYGDHEMMKQGFWEFVLRIRPGGTLIYKAGLESEFPEHWKEQLDDLQITSVSYGVENGQAHSKNLMIKEGRSCFDYQIAEREIHEICSALPGRHNVENATAAVTAALLLGVEEDEIKEGLFAFRGIFRRFERLYEDENMVYIDDYAHHPEELTAAIQAVRELYPGKKITGVFQPHLYSRTRDFADGFAKALEDLDEVVLLDIYPAREEPIPGIESRIILERMKNANVILVHDEDLMEYLSHHPSEVIITLGAGDIDLFRDRIKEWLNNK